MVRRREGFISHLGPVVVRTGQHTGRAAKDKFVVKEPLSQDKIWWGQVNIPFDEHNFELLHQRMCAYLQGRDIYIQDCYAGADSNYRIPVRVITETARITSYNVCYTKLLRMGGLCFRLHGLASSMDSIIYSFEAVFVI